MHDIFHHLEEQKILFCFSQACFGLRAVFGIFLAFRRPSAFFRPKNPSNSPQAKTTWLQQKKFFCSSSWLVCRCISPNLKTYHFLPTEPHNDWIKQAFFPCFIRGWSTVCSYPTEPLVFQGNHPIFSGKPDPMVKRNGHLCSLTSKIY